MSEAIPEDLMEKARGIANDWSMPEIGQVAVEVIAQALLSERKETIERCAALAESNDYFPEEGEHIAAAIRSLGRE